MMKQKSLGLSFSLAESMTNPYQTPGSPIEPVASDSISEQQKIYPPIALALGTFCGGLIAAGFMLLTNLEQQNRSGTAIVLIAAATSVTILSLFFSLFSPLGLIPIHIILNFIEAVLILFWASRSQANFIEQHELLGGQYHSNARAVMVGLGTSFALYLMLILASMMYSRLLLTQ